jgi:hypothetical protein
MKKIHFKTKLILNSQTIRRLRPSGLQEVQGGRIPYDSDLNCTTDLCTEGCTAMCTVGCRNCG